VFSGWVRLFKTNLTERPPMTNDMKNVRFRSGPSRINSF
jgi:hypothetical protein